MGGRGGASHGGGGGGIPFESFPADVFSAFRKMNALDFPYRRDADAVIRPWLDQMWDTLQNMEKYAVWQYTAGSGGFNRPLSGYVRRWDQFAGEGKVPWNTENKPMGLTGEFIQITGGAGIDYERGIVSLTNAIQKASIQNDFVLHRGSDVEGLAGILRGSIGFTEVKELIARDSVSEVQRKLIGQVAQSHAFLSTGIATDSGFHDSISYQIYAPKGTKGIYAEPQSNFGATTSGQELYKVGMGYTGVGGEAEVILQRGTQYRITNVTRQAYGRWVVEMEVISQPKFKTGKEKTTK